MSAEIVTRKNFEKFVRGNSHAVLDFTAPWCGYCRIIEPIVEELAAEYDGKVTFGKLDIDVSSEIADQFEIMTIPTLLFFKKGIPIDAIVGPVSKTVIQEKIDEVLMTRDKRKLSKAS